MVALQWWTQMVSWPPMLTPLMTPDGNLNWWPPNGDPIGEPDGDPQWWPLVATPNELNQ